MTTAYLNPPTHTPAASNSDPGYGQLFAILLRRRFWFLGIVAGVLCTAGVITLLTPPTYRSSMQLLVEPNYQGKQQAGQDQQADQEFTDTNIQVDSATQLNLMKSSSLLERAVTLLKSQYPDITVNTLQKNLDVRQVVQQDSGTNRKVNTKIFEVTYTDSNPDKTLKVLQTMQKVYQDYNLEQQEQRLAKGLSFIDKQLPQVKGQVNQSLTALEDFRKQQSLIDPELQATALTQSLNDTRNAQRVNQTRIQQLQANSQALQAQLKLTPQAALTATRLSQSNRYQSLLNEIQKTELALSQQRQRFRDNTPQIQELQEQLQNQRNLLRQERQRVGSSGGTQAAGAALLSQGQLGQLDQSLVQQLANTETELNGLKGERQALFKREQQLRQELARLPQLMNEYGRLQPEVQVRRQTLEQLMKARQGLGLEAARGGFDWQVVEPPIAGLKTGPKLVQNLLLGLVIGLILGGIAAFLREAIDNTVHSSDDLEKQISLPLLGLIPELKHPDSEPILNLSFRRSPLETPAAEVLSWGPFRESVDLLYKNIQLLNSEHPLRSLVVTSALSGEGKSTLALGLALSAARLNLKVLLIDGDLRRPDLHHKLELPNEVGFSTLLTSHTLPSGATPIRNSGLHSNLAVLTSGPMPADPVRLLSSQRMQELMAAFQQSYDLVIVDTPPVLGLVDAMLVASFCNAVVMVGRIGRVTRAELNQATTMLNRLNVIGVIANGADRSTYSYPSSYSRMQSR